MLNSDQDSEKLHAELKEARKRLSRLTEEKDRLLKERRKLVRSDRDDDHSALFDADTDENDKLASELTESVQLLKQEMHELQERVDAIEESMAEKEKAWGKKISDRVDSRRQSKFQTTTQDILTIIILVWVIFFMYVFSSHTK